MPAGRPPVCDDDNLAEVGDIPAGPLLDELGDGAMEQFVAFNPRLQDVVLDVADRHGRENCARDAALDPGAPFDEQGAARVRVQGSRPSQHLCTLRFREQVVDQHDRNLLADGVGSVQELHGIHGGELPAHAEVAAEAALKLRLDPVELGRIDVHCQQQRPHGAIGLPHGSRV